MIRLMVLGLVLLGLSSTAKYSQNAKPSYESAPDLYKVISENQDFRVIEATWKAGQLINLTLIRFHPSSTISMGYTFELHNADGKL